MTECRHSILGNPHAHVDDAREYRLGKLPEDVDFATSIRYDETVCQA